MRSVVNSVVRTVVRSVARNVGRDVTVHRFWFPSGDRTPLHSFQFTEIACCLFSLQRLHFVYSSVHLRHETFVGEQL